MAKAKAKVYGPFEVANLIGGETVNLLSMPFVEVVDSQIMVAVTDNVVAAVVLASQPAGEFLYGIVGVEFGFFGSVQGYDTLLKRQFVRSIWGPINIKLGTSDAYDQFFVRGRLFIGGKPGIPSDIVFATPLSVLATIHVQPREGVG